MKRYFTAGALALGLNLLSFSASAHEGPAGSGPIADTHAPAGIMADHMHKAGDVMVGLRLMREESGGVNVTGSRKLRDEAIAAAGFSTRVKAMTMDMAMLDIMWAPADNVTLMLMPQYMRMKMVMVGLPGADDHGGGHGGGGHGGGHALEPGDTHSHSVDGFGDTVAAALIRIARRPNFDAHLTMGISIPTGDVARKNDDGTFVHYGMQPGSGTWDAIPSLTATGGSGPVKIGGQIGYVWRTEKTNKSGFSFGDRFWTTAWASYRIVPAFSLSGRLAYSEEGKVTGHYNGPHAHASPADRQANYGGERVEIGLGANAVMRNGPLAGIRAGAELMLPVYQQLNGIQAPREWGLTVNVSRAF